MHLMVPPVETNKQHSKLGCRVGFEVTFLSEPRTAQSILVFGWPEVSRDIYSLKSKTQFQKSAAMLVVAPASLGVRRLQQYTQTAGSYTAVLVSEIISERDC